MIFEHGNSCDAWSWNVRASRDAVCHRLGRFRDRKLSTDLEGYACRRRQCYFNISK